jgi:radical SAM protein with 4Fe4S-binding SPASM domain
MVEGFALLGGEGIRFTGGEPLCHPDWLDLVRLARFLGYGEVSLQTNGMLFTERHAAVLAEHDFPGLKIQISLDGASAQSHDLVRGAGAFDIAVAGIGRLVRAGLGPRLSVFFTEMRHNLNEIPALFELCEDLGVASVATGSLVRCGRAAEGAAVGPAALHQYQRLLDHYEADPQFRALYAKCGTVAPLEWVRPDEHGSTGCTFVENPYLTPLGTLYPCLMCHVDAYAVSAVHQKGLPTAFAEGAPLWSSLLQLSRRRARSIPQCQVCPEARTCAGGCMGRAWGGGGDLMAADDRCELRRAIGRRKGPRGLK